MAVRNYPSVPIKAQHFSGEDAASHDFRSFSLLLRAIADWIEAEDIEDPEIDSLKFSTQFPASDSDDFYEAAILFYREKEG